MQVTSLLSSQETSERSNYARFKPSKVNRKGQNEIGSLCDQRTQNTPRIFYQSEVQVVQLEQSSCDSEKGMNRDYLVCSAQYSQ